MITRERDNENRPLYYFMALALLLIILAFANV